MGVEEKIEHILDDKVRPALLLHGGGIRSASFEDGVYRFRLVGRCANCPSAYLEAEELVCNVLLQAVPEIQRAVLEVGVSQDLLDQAKMILDSRESGL